MSAVWLTTWELPLIEIPFAASFALQMRHNYLYKPPVIASLICRKGAHQIGQLHQVGDPQKRSPIAHDDFRIRAYKISPLRGDRPNGGIASLQQKAFAMLVVSPADTWQLPCE